MKPDGLHLWFDKQARLNSTRASIIAQEAYIRTQNKQEFLQAIEKTIAWTFAAVLLILAGIGLLAIFDAI